MNLQPTSLAERLVRAVHGRVGVQLAVVALLAGLAYANTFNASFHFDDTRNIVANSLIRDFENFLDLSRAKAHPYYNDFKMRPVGFLSFALNYRLHGLRVAGFHVLNLLIHVVNGFLVYLLVVLAFRTPALESADDGGRVHDPDAAPDRPRLIAFFSALLFVCHPIQTQAVTYIVQRFASLATTFYLGAVLAYLGSRLLDARQRHLAGGALYLLALVSTVLAMKTKELAFTIPIVIALGEVMFFPRPAGGSWRRFVLLLPFLLTLPLIPLSAIDFADGGGSVASRLAEQSRVLTAMTRTEYFLTQLTVIPVYLRLLVFPIGQNLDHDHPLYSTLLDGRVALSSLLLLSLLVFGVAALRRARGGDRRWRLMAFGIFWFFLTMLPESSVIPIVDVLFEHRMYLPSVGLFLALCCGLFMLGEGLRSRYPQALKVSLLLGWAVVLALAGATYARNRVWRDETTLWEDVVRKSPNKDRARNTLGSIYLDTQRLELAAAEFRRTLAINPGYWAAQVNLGTCYLMQARKVHLATGSADQALALIAQGLAAYEQALAMQPDTPMVGSLIDSARQLRSDLQRASD